MTDLLTPAETDQTGLDSSGEALPRKTFRAATLDDAVAAARTEFGPDVELLEAHRVRRGGLGGFFATDLGVEIIATPRPAVTATSVPGARGADPASMDGGSASAGPAAARSIAPSGAPAMPTVMTRPSLVVPTETGDQELAPILPVAPASAEVVTALDRLIEHAESIDRAIPVEHSARTPLPSMTDEIDPLWRTDVNVRPDLDPSSFEAHLQTELAALDEGVEDRPAPALDRSHPAAMDSVDVAVAETLRRSTTDDLTVDTTIDDLPADTTLEDRSVDTTMDEDRSVDPTMDEERSTDTTAIDTTADDTTELIRPDDLAGADRPADDEPAATLAPPSPLLNPSLRAVRVAGDAGSTDGRGSIEEIDALLRDVGIDVDEANIVETDRGEPAPSTGTIVPSPSAPSPVPMPVPAPIADDLSTIDEAATAITDRLVEGILELQRQSTHPVRRFSVSLTMPDGTSIGLSTELGDPAPPALAAGIDATSDLFERSGPLVADDDLDDETTAPPTPAEVGQPGADHGELSIGESVLLARLLDGTVDTIIPASAHGWAFDHEVDTLDDEEFDPHDGIDDAAAAPAGDQLRETGDA